MTLKMNQNLKISSADGDESFYLSDIKEFYVVRSTILERSANFIHSDTTYHLIAILNTKDRFQLDDVIIKYKCSYEYLLDFLYTLSDYAFS